MSTNGINYSQTQGLKLSTNSIERLIISTGGTVSIAGITSASDTDVLTIDGSGAIHKIAASTFGGAEIYVTGGTYSNGITTFKNNTGGTFNVSGYYTGYTDVDVILTGGTYNSGTGVATFTNSTGGTFNVTGFSTGGSGSGSTSSLTIIGLTGTQNGSNTTFTLASAIAGEHMFFLNGQLQTYTDDYTIVGTTLTTVLAPSATDKLKLLGSVSAISVTTSGPENSLQFKSGSSLSGASYVYVKNGNLSLSANTGNSATASTNNILVYNYNVGGRDMLGITDEFGYDNALQTMLSRNGTALWLPTGNATTITTLGTTAPTATGTATVANVATTNRHTYMKRVDYLVTTAAATAVAGFRGVAQYALGANAGDGGFHFICRFGPATGVATTTNRLFVGMSSSTAAPTDVQPSSLTNIIGAGWDAADANIQFMCNDGTGTATKVDLGIAVPLVDRTSVYELAMFCPPATTTTTYTFRDLAQGGLTVTGSVATDLPANTTLLAPRGYMSVGGTSSVIGIALMSLSIESDY